MFEPIQGGYLKTTKELTYGKYKVKKNDVFDGGTMKGLLFAIFSNKDYNKGLIPFAFHDMMCKNREQYTLKESTDLLCELWRLHGLAKWKYYIVYGCVYTFQYFKGGWKK